MPTDSSTSLYTVELLRRTAGGAYPVYTPPVSDLSFSYFVGKSRTHGGPVWDYKRRLSNGSDATTTFSGSQYVVKQSSKGRAVYHAENAFGWGHYELTGDLSYPELAQNVFIDSSVTDDKAKAKFVSAIRSAQTSLQGGVVLGEIGETLRAFRSPLKALRSGIDDYLTTLRKGRRGTLDRKRKFLSETWLEYSYGWAPLLSDAKSAAKALAEYVHGKPEYQYVRGYAEDVITSADGQFGLGDGPLAFYVGDRSTTKAIVIYRGVIRAPVGNRSLMTRRNLGLDLNNFVPTIWELIPYSFLVDYFSNAGDVLSAWSLWDVDFAWANKTIVTISQRERFTKDLIGKTNDPTVLEHSLTPCTSRTERRSVNRGPIGSLVPSLRFEIPGVSSLKWLNLAALGRTHAHLLPF